MFHHRVKHSLPHWPEVPARLWLTAAGIALAALSLRFGQDLWQRPAQAQFWTWVALTLLLLPGGLQTIGVLLHWPATCGGPRWMRFAIGCVALALGLGVALFTLVLSFFSGMRAAFLSAG